MNPLCLALCVLTRTNGLSERTAMSLWSHALTQKIDTFDDKEAIRYVQRLYTACSFRVTSNSCNTRRSDVFDLY